jgi:hypothetical protein
MRLICPSLLSSLLLLSGSPVFAQNYQAMAQYMRQLQARGAAARAAQQAAQQGAAGFAVARPGVPQALHPAFNPQAPTYYGGGGSVGGFGGTVGGMMQGMGFGLTPGETPGGVTGMMQGMGLGLPAGATPAGGAIQPLGGTIQPPYQGEVSGPGPGTLGTEGVEARGVGSSIPPGYIDGSGSATPTPIIDPSTPAPSQPKETGGPDEKPNGPNLPEGSSKPDGPTKPDGQNKPGSPAEKGGPNEKSPLAERSPEGKPGAEGEKPVKETPKEQKNWFPFPERGATAGPAQPWTSAFQAPSSRSEPGKSATPIQPINKAFPGEKTNSGTTPSLKADTTSGARAAAPKALSWTDMFQKIPNTAFLPGIAERRPSTRPELRRTTMNSPGVRLFRP